MPKNTIGVKSAIETNQGSTLTDSFEFHSTKREQLKVNVRDRQGNTMPLDAYIAKIKNEQTPLGTCGLTPTALSHVQIWSDGFYFGVTCFAQSGPPQPFPFGMTFELSLPASITPNVFDAQSNAQVQLAPTGWTSTPATTAYRTGGINAQLLTTWTDPQDGTQMNLWKITAGGLNATRIDYCLNFTIQSILPVKTNCDDFTLFSNATDNGGPITDNFFIDVNKKIAPNLLIDGNTIGGAHKINISWTYPVCALSNCNKTDYHFWFNYKCWYRKASGGPILGTSIKSNLNSVSIPVSLAGNYNFYYVGDEDGSGAYNGTTYTMPVTVQ